MALEMKISYFSIKRDLEIEGDGGFWCEACLLGKPSSERSHDRRYCNFCYDLLTEEAKLDKSWSRAGWKPITSPPHQAVEGKTEGLKPMTYPSGQAEVLTRSNTPPNHALQNPTRNPRINPGGRPRKEAPTKDIKKLSKQGLGTRDIARELNLSPSMVSRTLAGKRKEVVKIDG